MIVSAKLYEHVVLDERYYKACLPNGLNIIICPKKNSANTVISASVKFGSGNSAFKLPNDSLVSFIPAGTAHFLEHIVFCRGNEKSFMNIFNSLNVDVNGYTAHNHTCFTAELNGSDINTSINLLLDLVFNNKFSDANVENERKVIYREGAEGISDYRKIHSLALSYAYKEDASSEVYNGILDCFGFNNDDLSTITRDLLLKCHEIFYHPKNMLFTVVGNVKPRDVILFLEAYFKYKVFAEFQDVRFFVRSECVEGTNVDYVGSKDISKTGFVLKMNSSNYLERLKFFNRRVLEVIAISMMCTYLFGENGTVRDSFMEEGYEISEICYDFQVNDAYRHLFLSFYDVEHYDNLVPKIVSAIKKFKSKNFSNKKFALAKKMLYADVLTHFDNNYSLMEFIVEMYCFGIDLEEYINGIINITKEELISMINLILENGAFYATYVG